MFCSLPAPDCVSTRIEGRGESSIFLWIAQVDIARDPKGHQWRDRVINQWLGQPVPSIVTSATGKPRLDPPLCRFSFSRSLPFAAIGISADHEIGIDIETRACDATAEEVAPACMNDHERSAWLCLQPPARLERFLFVWRLKEAILKASGDGLLRDPREIEVCSDAPRPRILRLPAEYPPPASWEIGEWVPPSPFPALAWAAFPKDRK